MPADEPVLVATRSEGKLRELMPLFEQAGIRAITLVEAGIDESLEEETIESFESFEENALAKARYFHELSGLETVADDSGLCVDALAGAPGVSSKRYSGKSQLTGQALDDANNARLQAELRDCSDRAAKYKCAAAWVNRADEVVAIGETHGSIVTDPRGTNGFGYDPYFYSSDLHMTFGEADVAAKQAVSHRGRAFAALFAALRERAGR